MKKDGGTITNWQLHHLVLNDDQKKYMKKYQPNVDKENPMVFTGTVVDDPIGRWQPGFHMRSSLIVNLNREKGIIETANTMYKVQNEGNDVVPDMGNAILGIFY